MKQQCFILFSSFPLLFAFVVGGLGFEFCVFVAGWRHVLRSKWPFTIIIITSLMTSDGPADCIASSASLKMSRGACCTGSSDIFPDLVASACRARRHGGTVARWHGGVEARRYGGTELS